MSVEDITFPKEVVQIDKFKPFVELTVSTEEEAGFVTDRRKEVKDQINSIEKTRKSFTEPLLETKKRIDAQAKRLSEPLERILGILNHKLLAWHNSQEEIRIQAEKKKREEELQNLEKEKSKFAEAAEVYGDEEALNVAAQIETNQAKLAVKPIEIQRNTRTATSTAYVASYWDFEVIDEKLIPDEYWTLNEVALRKIGVALKEKANVPGVKFIKKQRIGG